MSDYIVSARKYRPDSFETLIGQDNIAQTLKNSILRGQIAHAYLFCGPRGVGKTSMARLFAKAINCSNPSADMEPCGECESCVSFKEGRSYCIHELDAASNNGVEDIKALMEQVQVPPQVGKYGVYIIDEVHMLSQQAFNAFLKTLEEPPAHAVFILATTEKHKIIPTILSRCQTYDFNRISIRDMVRNLSGIAAKEGISIDDESLHIIAQKADGAMRDALTIFDQTVAFCGTDVHREDVIRNLNVLDYEYSFRLVDAFLQKDYPTALLIFDEILAKGFNAMHFVGSLSSHFRDLIVCRTAGLDGLLDLSESLKDRYRGQSARCDLPFLYKALEICVQCEAGFKMSTNPRLHIEFSLMKLSFLAGMPPVRESVTAPAPSAAPETATSAAPEPAAAAVPVRPATANVRQMPVSATPQASDSTESPKVTETPEAPAADSQPAPHHKVSRAASALSFASMLNSSENSAKRDAIPADSTVSDEAILEKWKALAESYMSVQPRLSNALLTAQTEIKELDGMKVLVFKVMNVSQQKWIREQKLLEMEGKLCDMLSSRLKLDVDLMQEDVIEDKPYMPVEQAEDLMANNQQVKDLIIDLELDIK